MTHKPMLIILNGTSGAGKTFLLNNLHSINNCFVPIKEFTTRARRDYEDVSAVDLVFSCSESYIKSCAIQYRYKNEYYGLDYNQIAAEICKGHIPVVIIHSFQTIREMKRIFSNVITVFVFGLTGVNLKQRLLEQGRSESQIQASIDSRQATLEDLENNIDIVDEYIYNLNEKKDLFFQFQSIATKEMPK